MKWLKAKPKFKRSPKELLEIALALIMASTVLIIPTADKTTFYREKSFESHSYAENATDESTRAFWASQEVKYNQKIDKSVNSLILTSMCAIVSLVGVYMYLLSNNAKFLLYASFLGLLAFIDAIFFLVLALFG